MCRKNLLSHVQALPGVLQEASFSPPLLDSTGVVQSSAGSPWWSTSWTARAHPANTRHLSGGTPRGTVYPPQPYSQFLEPRLCQAHLTVCSVSHCSNRPRPPSPGAHPSIGSCLMAPGNTHGLPESSGGLQGSQVSSDSGTQESSLFLMQRQAPSAHPGRWLPPSPGLCPLVAGLPGIPELLPVHL